MKPSIEHEIELARNAGVNHAQNYPFLLTPNCPNHQGILLVHGFTSTPREMRALAEHLVELNFTVLGVRLPGHGTSPEDLAGSRAEEWLATVERGYQILQQMNLTISAVGLSTGALLLMQLSRLHHLEHLVLLSPYLRLKHPLAPLARLLSLFIPFAHRDIDLADRPFYYQRRPLKGIVQINRLRKKVKKHLKQITTPTLILASTGDKTIHPGTAEDIYKQLPCLENEYHCYGDDVPHVLTTAENPCQMDVFRRTASFLTVPATEPDYATNPAQN